MRGAADVVEVGAVRERVLEETELELRGQDPRDGVVDPAHGDHPVLDELVQIGDLMLERQEELARMLGGVEITAAAGR